MQQLVEAPTRDRRVPLGPTGQLALLQQTLERCEVVLRAGRDRAAAAMRDGELEERERWDAVRGQRVLAHKISREILPLLARVPQGVRTGSAWADCERAGHSLRRAVEGALRDHANHAVDLANAAGLPAPR